VEKKFGDLEIKEGRIYNDFVALPREYRPFARFKRKPYVATLDIRACHPTFLGQLLRGFYQQEGAAIAAKLNGHVDQHVLEAECSRWTDIFSHPTIDPRGVIMNEAGMTIGRRDMKHCVNTWLNGAKKYLRETDGRWDMKNNKRLEAWFQGRFPEIARVWTAMEQRQITGRVIMEEYEGPLMLDRGASYGTLRNNKSLAKTVNFEDSSHKSGEPIADDAVWEGVVKCSLRWDPSGHWPVELTKRLKPL